jgi:hypothetical protein
MHPIDYLRRIFIYKARDYSMKKYIVALILLSAILDQAIADNGQSKEDTYILKMADYNSNVSEIKGLIKAGRLKEAEEAILHYEPNYARRWSIGNFGYKMRMQIGQAFLERGNQKEALRIFKTAKPGGGCGNCMASQHIRRNIRVAKIYESRFNFPAAFAEYCDALPRTILGGSLFAVTFGLFYTGGITITPCAAVALCFFYKRRQTLARRNAP